MGGLVEIRTTTDYYSSQRPGTWSPATIPTNGEGGRKPISREEARTNLRRIQQYIGAALIVSAAAASYLLATDGSLWILAVSHAAGLVIIATIDLALGILSLCSYRRAYLASLAAAVLGIALQLGDVMTAPQYNMTVPYFASYLFGLGAFDLLLALQGAIVFVGVLGRAYVELLSRRGKTGRELNYSRRNFARAVVWFAALVGLGVLLGSIRLPPPPSSAPPPQQAGPASPITNANSLQAGTPVYFDYPSGYPNILVRNADGSLTAVSLVCTHVCCECVYEKSANVIYCPCHGSVFDTRGRVLRGPAGSPLPSVTLNVDSSGNVFPSGVTGHSPCG